MCFCVIAAGVCVCAWWWGGFGLLYGTTSSAQISAVSATMTTGTVTDIELDSHGGATE